MARTEYWLQIENHSWDVSPNGVDRRTGQMLTRGVNGLFKPLARDALIIRRYSPNWAAPADVMLNPWDVNEPNPAQTNGTIPGATIEAKVGDELLVHFRNKDQRAGLSDAERTHSLHVQGMQHSAIHDGAYPLSPPDPAQSNKQGDRVAPGADFTYTYSVLHAANAGVWLYYDQSKSAAASIAQGAFGAVVVRGAGEARPILPTQPIRTATDTSTNFSRVPAPPAAGEHLFVLHELADVGICLNGRQLLGNTPSVIARTNTRVKFRVANMTNRALSFHVHGHRWTFEDDWIDTRHLGAGSGATFEWLEGTSENGGVGNGEWALVTLGADKATGSLIIMDGGALALPVGAL